jgi:hypothetical protein
MATPFNTTTQSLWDAQASLSATVSSLTEEELAQVEQEVCDLLLVLERERTARTKPLSAPVRLSA